MKDRLTTLELLRRMKSWVFASLWTILVPVIPHSVIFKAFHSIRSRSTASITSMETDVSARAIVRAIVGLGRSLDLPVVAEGIETFDQHRMVIEEGCEQVQGSFRTTGQCTSVDRPVFSVPQQKGGGQVKPPNQLQACE